MDFSAFNPISTNGLSLAARSNNVGEVKRLLQILNPNCTDNRGWTCLHEAAANDHIECLKLIIQHPETRLLAETFEGHTALYLAVREKSSPDTIKLLLEKIDDIINYASTEMVSPLHLACQQGRLEIIQLLLEYNTYVNLADLDGDTPLHDAAFSEQPEALKMLLHNGADPDRFNERGFSPFHLACMRGNIRCVEELYPFIADIDEVNDNGETGLFIATEYGQTDVVQFLLWNGADANLVNENNQLPLDRAIRRGYPDVFKLLYKVTDERMINFDIILLICKPHNFNMEIFQVILESDLGPEYFHAIEPFFTTLERLGGLQLRYKYCPPLASMLHICEYVYKRSPEHFRKLFYLFLMRGVPVNPQCYLEVPPLVYLHYCEHKKCCYEVIEILVSMGANVDYCGDIEFPNAILASISTTGLTLAKLLTYSVSLDDRQIIEAINNMELYGRLWPKAREELKSICGASTESTLKDLLATVSTLKQCCRRRIRASIKLNCKSTEDYLHLINQLPLPQSIIDYLRYL